MEFNSVLAEHVFQRVGGDCVHPTDIEGLTLFSSTQNIPVMPIVLQPSICFVLQGSKQLSSGKSVYQYDPSTYLINSVTRPVDASVSRVDPNRPYVGASLRIDRQMLGQLMMEMSQWQSDDALEQQMELTQSTAITPEIMGNLARLIRTADDPMDRQVLSASLCRELYYQVLKGPSGGLLRNSVNNHAGANRITPVVHYIEQHFERNLGIDEISDVAGMSASTLHEHFKQVTSVSPMQYVKSLRLHKARSMLSLGSQVAEVCYAVGYSSPSQFSREFKRYFGITPSEAKSAVIAIG
ncbi:AraC family transcriptional regulator [Enterovibrio norvegicus]|uniref:AraC family transcriptional regulator n=1 Tax=Enterovibrio norvegicus TaxID=188144 RepID=A0A2N7LGW9_9GAMM|nr:AraC family transcriptional regulator [Enterovibrio norvegicus]PMN94735.1 AraC family transcriptional regulator [Enterovibrio norvegicus]